MRLKSVVISVFIIILFTFVFTLAVDVLEVLVEKMNKGDVIVIRGGVQE